MSGYMYGEAIHDACVQLGRELGSVGPPDPAFDRAFDAMQEARAMAQEKVRTRVPDPFGVVHALQGVAREHPEARAVCDDAITVILVLNDKRVAAMAALRDLEWKR